MYEMLIGAEIVDVLPCGVKPVMLLYSNGLWLVYRTGVRCYKSEAMARKCMRCILDHKHKQHCSCPDRTDSQGQNCSTINKEENNK